MEYFRNPENQIYADLAYRMGRIIVQYEKMSIEDEKFEATLYIAVLQNIMTICREHVKGMFAYGCKDQIFNRKIKNTIWGVSENCWVKNTFNERRTLEKLITHIRNSLSHPTNIDIKGDFPSTGFTTIKDSSGVINAFRFIDSPDTENNRQNNMPLFRISIIDFTIDQLGEFVKELVNYLAQPIQKDWDGRTIKYIIAA